MNVFTQNNATELRHSYCRSQNLGKVPTTSSQGVERFRHIKLCFEDVSYPFWLGTRCTDQIIAHLSTLSASSFQVVTDETVASLHAQAFAIELGEVCPTRLWTIDGGELGKSLTSLELLANRLLSAGADRSSVVVAMGGGVVGNIAGLVSALLFRGIRLVHVPTTMIAMSDSVISLKQAINMPQGKNLIGCFHSPTAVFADTSYLSTLPAEHIRSGLCELIKNALSIESAWLPQLEGLLRADALYNEGTLATMVEAGVAAKQSVMIDDKHERRRAILFEYGHTVGHAIELACAGRLSHGQAVGLGMIVAAEVSHEMGHLSAGDRDKHYQLLALNGVTIEAPSGITPEMVMSAVRCDNKRGYLSATPDQIPMILLERLGVPLCVSGHRPLVLVDARLVESTLRRRIFHESM